MNLIRRSRSRALPFKSSDVRSQLENMMRAVGLVVLAVPLLAASSMTAWQYLWVRRVEGPLGKKSHLALACTQAMVGFGLLLPWSSNVLLPVTAGLYGVLASGAAYFLIRRGRIECGCWGGSSSEIGPKLIALDATAACMATALYVLVDVKIPNQPIAILFAVAVLSIVFLVSVSLPEARWAYRGVSARAKRHVRWLRDFPDLPYISEVSP